ncbi:MAG TPA: hypothetical protein VH370_17435 [Humisphaera sp.]|jgi:uncharacterized protein (DUF433 family)|nr:hypothetical protein [Humisphaera sp.]
MAQMIGHGVYALSEAARYAGLPVGTVRSWFKPRSDHRGQGPLFRSDYGPIEDDYAISFLNLIEAYVARFFRKEGVKAPILRRAHEVLQTELDTVHPFAHSALRTDGKRIIRQKGDAELVDVISRQHFFGQMKLSRIAYSPTSRLAQSWAISDGVVIDPTLSFGKPVVERTGVTTFVLANQYKANRGDAALVARLFSIKDADVLNAVKFEAGLSRLPKAA